MSILLDKVDLICFLKYDMYVFFYVYLERGVRVAHLEKLSRAKLSGGSLLKHDSREQGEIERKNENIDYSRTHLNYNLAPHNKKAIDFIDEKVKDLERKNSVVCCSWVVTLPKYNEIYLERYRGQEIEDIFFQNTYNFLADRYGADNVASAWVHKDETTPHLHFKFVPLTADGRLSARDICTRQEYNTFHKDLQKYLDERTGIDFPVLNEATKEGNKSIEELKRGTAKKEIKYLKTQIDVLNKQISTKKAELEDLTYDVQVRASTVLQPIQSHLDALERMGANIGELGKEEYYANSISENESRKREQTTQKAKVNQVRLRNKYAFGRD